MQDGVEASPHTQDPRTTERLVQHLRTGHNGKYNEGPSTQPGPGINCLACPIVARVPPLIRALAQSNMYPEVFEVPAFKVADASMYLLLPGSSAALQLRALQQQQLVAAWGVCDWAGTAPPAGCWSVRGRWLLGCRCRWLLARGSRWRGKGGGGGVCGRRTPRAYSINQDASRR
jgi:hypothetical protein